MSVAKTLRRLLSGTSDAAIRFDELCSLLQSLGFDRRMRGSHHLFRKSGVEERINLQREGNNAKPYQVKQVRAVILKYKLVELNEQVRGHHLLE
ncbi:MAG: type II toxin-antitoxin system HicA family toxin [Acidobacteria bacterium]|nr:type II toxin-antitoxin system HicA family toxin [Acidobacteriota bacterium]